MPNAGRAIALSATFTVEAIQPGLAFWIGELGLDYEIRFAGYNTVFQQLLDPAGLFAANRGGINVALARLEDWLGAGAAQQARRFADAARRAAASCPAPLIVAILPSEARAQWDVRRGAADAARALSAADGVLFIGPSDLADLYPAASRTTATATSSDTCLIRRRFSPPWPRRLRARSTPWFRRRSK